MTPSRGQRLIAVLVAIFSASAGAAEHGGQELLTLCYHDVVESQAAARADPTAVTVDALVQQLTWLEAEGYQPVSLATWAAARRGGPLPDKPVLLTFDDGYASFHEHVLPLLELFDFPAVISIVTSWLESPAGSLVPYGEQWKPRDAFLSWQQIREAVGSGLVEVASHSHDLHRGITGNPFGNLQPAAVTRRYDPEARQYESEARYRQRVREDLAASVELIERHAAVRPRAVAWPYGAYNATVSAVARTLGLEHSLTLDTLSSGPLEANVHRRLIGSDMDLPAFVRTVLGLYPRAPLRAAHVDLDYLYDPDPAQQEKNLDVLLDRIQDMAISAVFLQAFADPDGDGVADAAYFPNRHLPLRADLFNRVAWQLRTRVDVRVFAWMPVLAFELPDAAQSHRLAVRAAPGSRDPEYHRLSPFHPDTRRIVAEIYDDLGRSSHFSGVLFHDDAFLSDHEDASATAVDFYRREWPELTPDWEQTAKGAGPDGFARAKTRHLIELTSNLAEVLRRHQPGLVTARNLYARPVLEPESERWFAHNLRLFLDAYDYTVVMAMPYLERAAAPERWLEGLVARVDEVPHGVERTVFEIQTRDWQSGAPLEGRVIARHLETLLHAGVRHIAWYPDDFVAGHPHVQLIRATVSLADHPALAE